MEEQINALDPDKLINLITSLAVEYVPKLLLAILVLIVGLWLIKKVKKVVAKRVQKSSGDETLGKFLTGIIVVILQLILAISVIGMVGVETTSFIAILGSAGLAIGLALQGSLGNFAGGVLILLLKPFKVNDVIDAGGEIGLVTDIGIFATTMVNAKKRTIIIPNGSLSNNTIVNFTRQGILRCEVAVGIAYDADIKKAKEVILETITADERVLKDPAADVVVTGLGDSSVNLEARMFTATADNWPVFFEMNQKVKEALDAAGIEIPFPQRVVHQAKS